MKNFVFVTDVNNGKHCLNTDYVVEIVPKNGSLWQQGSVIRLNREASEYPAIHLDGSETEKLMRYIESQKAQ